VRTNPHTLTMELPVIVDLKDTPHVIPTLAAWHQAEWATTGGLT
jgi:hypothetical protein